MSTAQLVLKSNSVFTGDSAGAPFAGGVAIADGRILACGDDAALEPFIGPDTEVRSYGDKLIMPGFHDAHLHIHMAALMFSPFMMMIGENHSEMDCVEQVKPFAETRPHGSWIVTCGWYLPFWDTQKLPTKESLDEAFPYWPVCMSSGDGHTAWLNSLAMERLGITDETPDPVGGEFVRDAEGHHTGVAKEMAGTKVYMQVLNEFSDEEVRAAYDGLFADFRRCGVTSVCDMGATSLPGADLLHPEILQEYLDADKLTCRVNLFPTMTKTMERPKAMRETYTHPRLSWRGVKQFLDGVSSTHTAYLTEPYANAYFPGDRGTLTVAEDEMDELVYLANKNGMSVRIHAIGDGAIRAGLNSFERAQKQLGPDPAIRNSLEHIENILEPDIKRFAELGAVASMQPAHSMIDPAGIEADLGLERTKLMWAFRDILDTGAHMAFGTDIPTAGLDPIHNVSYAVTRSNLEGKPEGGWEYHQHIEVAEALAAYTSGSAYVAHCEAELGTLETGKLADIVVIDRDLFAIPAAEIREATVAATLIDGEFVYEA